MTTKFPIFKEVCEQHRDDYTPWGDFANDALNDLDFPWTTDRNGMLEYLDRLGACQEAIDAFKEIRKYAYDEPESSDEADSFVDYSCDAEE